MTLNVILIGITPKGETGSLVADRDTRWRHIRYIPSKMEIIQAYW